MTVRLAWRSDGPPDAPPLVLLNSLGTTTEMWTPVLAPLAERFRVIRIDTRGHGASPAAVPGEPGTIDGLGEDVLAVLDDIGIARAAFAGLSLGGMTAMWLAIHRPERVERLALLCTSAHMPPASAWEERAAAIRARGMPAVAHIPGTTWLTAELAARDPELVAELNAMLASTDPDSYAQCCAAIASLDLRADLGRIAAPTLVLAGAGDPAAPPARHGAVIADAVAGARLVVLEHAAHLATYEQPGRIAQLLLDHFDHLNHSGDGRAGTGDATRRAVLGDAHVDRAGAATTPFDAPFQDFITRYAWGDVWARPGLGRRERSIATLAALVALGAEQEIALHVRGALNNGLTEAELAEVFLHTAVYAGLPRANRAFAIAREVLASSE
jgi:3-oxoadipate enol-lactonase/4-carboxymuconolactone decarboxylase